MFRDDGTGGASTPNFCQLSIGGLQIASPAFLWFQYRLAPHIGYYHYRVGTKTIWLAPRDPIQLSMGPQKLNNWISHGLKLWKCCVFELWSFFGVFKLIWQIPRNQKVKNEKFAPIFFDKKWVNFNRLWVNMVSIRMIVKSGQKNELQNLGFCTY